MSKLTLKNITMDNKKFDEMKEITFPDGHTLNIYQRFSFAKINQVFESMTKISEESKAVRGVNLNKFELLDFLSLLLIEHFTDLKFSKNLRNKFDEYETLLNSDYYSLIIKAFDKKEIDKFYNYFSEKLQLAEKMIKQGENVKQQINEINNQKDELFAKSKDDLDEPKPTN
ncbi:hypothetical protein [Heyndrickxia oleronia]|jgi:hypothetical protein|uniref:hypothetical protein n=1 Tax=Heyndrickxia oleronia TaxID=38875 RepID=UPI0024315A3D|nr:hypothetical protein [Heyndrickxia oleronia]MCI1590394.1 hypothetical protein [Heyndrickxia oleronia]MCI1611344.1 hypothetical protein [Heyndrickxia oleronia]MCI1742787.1 hypothetical protein [Heyndrickxia oleronia]MCI1763128.1 hypothetical protein [Heyndrickxia oleronia]